MLVELLLDLLPLRRCFATRERRLPPAIEQAIRRMLSMLRYMRLGGGDLARFNGMGQPFFDGLATVIAYEHVEAPPIETAPQSRYARLEHDRVVLIADVGSPPPLELAGQAHAGCLSFELSIGTVAVLVNGGAPGPAEQQWRAQSRATASHNTLCLGAKSSSKLVRHALLNRLVGADPIRFPDDVRHSRQTTPAASVLEASHDGYLARFGLIHKRRLALTIDGARLDGLDEIGPPRGTLRLAQDVPFAIHFHLHPAIRDVISSRHRCRRSRCRTASAGASRRSAHSSRSRTACTMPMPPDPLAPARSCCAAPRSATPRSHGGSRP